MSRDGTLRYNRHIDRWYIDIKWQGERHHIYKYLGQFPCLNEEAGNTLLKIIRSEIDKGEGCFNPKRYKRKKPLHLAQYAETWLDEIRVSEGTLHDYKNSLRNHILPVLGHEYIGDINFAKLRRLQNSITRAPSGKRSVMACLSKLMRDAYRSGDLRQRPEFPGFSGQDSVVPPPIIWIDEADQWKIIEHIPQRDRPIFLFMKFTGCRPSEARAFRKQDIKPDHIVFAVTFGKGQILKEVKGKKVRTFPRIEALNALFSSLTLGVGPFVFLSSRQKPYTFHINRIWNQACDAAGVLRVKLNKSMRHSWGCQMLNAGLDKAVVQRVLGHTNAKMTDRYAEHSTNALKIALDNVIRWPICKVTVESANNAPAGT